MLSTLHLSATIYSNSNKYIYNEWCCYCYNTYTIQNLDCEVLLLSSLHFYEQLSNITVVKFTTQGTEINSCTPHTS